ncbi:Adenosine kinase 2 [Symbiodinium microadriaticum]|uniref:Adenosine kinase n=1 Tax=Symbiodinium microadriaticum TaxID=2951 RepID=A0A1Q9ECE5_SYMMI|nr:Adenosine kinase 2 [Symbiodinium microadriaticum]CAE7191796.1 ADK2 [Symbiodinium sp. KB8]
MAHEPPEEVVEFVLDARYGEQEAVQEAIAAGVQVNARSHGGSTALFMASANGHTGIVRELLQARASADFANDAGNCPLHWAALNGHLEVVKILIAARADANLKNEFQKRPFDEAFSRSHAEICEALATVTSFEDDVPADAEMREAEDADASETSRDRPPKNQPEEHPAILGMGNPLLDILAVVPEEMFVRYDLVRGSATLAEMKHDQLFEELASLANVQFLAGGATLNSIRVAQWLLQEPGMTAYMGCIGADDFGTRLANECKSAGIAARFLVDKDAPTGTCAVTILDAERSLTTRLGAASKYKLDHVKDPENFAVLKSARIIYSAGFFITVSPETIDLASRVAEMSGSIYCLNLSAAFIVQVPAYRAVLEKSLPHCDILFGNETEAQAYAEAAGWDSTDVAFIATRLSLVPMSGKKPHRKVVITQGADPTVVAERGHVTYHPVPQLPPEKIVDTNGAGDAFVGGFLAAFSRGRSLSDCCETGAYAAATVIQHSGCTFPPKPSRRP